MLQKGLTTTEDVVFNGEKIAEWAGTKVVRKEGSSPESAEDGILIADSTVRDQYSTDGLQDTDVAAGTQYNYTLFPYTTKNIYTLSDLNKISGSLLSYDPILENNTWAQIAEASKAGIAKDIWNLNDAKGDYIIAGFDHDDLADGSGKAGITFLQNNIDTCPKGIWGAASTWEDSNARGTLSEVYNALDEEIKNAIVTVKKDYKRAYDSYYYNYVDEHLFLLSEYSRKVAAHENTGFPKHPFFLHLHFPVEVHSFLLFFYFFQKTIDKSADLCGRVD